MTKIWILWVCKTEWSAWADLGASEEGPPGGSLAP